MRPGAALDDGGGYEHGRDAGGLEHHHHHRHHHEHHDRMSDRSDEGYDGDGYDGEGAGDHDHRRHHAHHDDEHHDARAAANGRARAARPRGRAFGYCEELPREPELPRGAPRGAPRARALDDAPPQALTIPTKLHIVEVVAAADTGATSPLGAGDMPQYSAFNPDTEFHDHANPAYHRQHIGLSFGLIQFTQRSGALGKVLAAYRGTDPGEFAQVFGPSADELLRVTNAQTPDARLAPVEGRVLWDPVWTNRFVEAGRRQGCRTAQRKIAVEAFLDPHLPIAAWLGLDSERALAMLYDRCVHQGNGAGLAWVVRTAGPIQTQLQREEALRALGYNHLGAFQASVPYLEQSDGWGPATHAAMAMRLRELGARSPVAVPTLAQMLESPRRRRAKHRRVPAARSAAARAGPLGRTPPLVPRLIHDGPHRDRARRHAEHPIVSGLRGDAAARATDVRQQPASHRGRAEPARPLCAAARDA